MEPFATTEDGYDLDEMAYYELVLDSFLKDILHFHLNFTAGSSSSSEDEEYYQSDDVGRCYGIDHVTNMFKYVGTCNTRSQVGGIGHRGHLVSEI